MDRALHFLSLALAQSRTQLYKCTSSSAVPGNRISNKKSFEITVQPTLTKIEGKNTSLCGFQRIRSIYSYETVKKKLELHKRNDHVFMAYLQWGELQNTLLGYTFLHSISLIAFSSQPACLSLNNSSRR